MEIKWEQQFGALHLHTEEYQLITVEMYGSFRSNNSKQQAQTIDLFHYFGNIVDYIRYTSMGNGLLMS